MQGLSKRILPKLIVFDLDMCLWSPETYVLDEQPSKKIIGKLGNIGEGVIGVQCGSQTLKLFPDVITILQDFYNNKYPEVKLAIASSADTPFAVQIAKNALNMLEILPGVTIRQVIQKGWQDNFDGHIQIGRTPPLSSRKSKSHFPLLLKNTGIAYTDMIFFDDCNWDDNCKHVELDCPGVVTQRTPNGLQLHEWNKALDNYQKKQGAQQDKK
ncbi:acid phosphatase (macronuclear) [Tetrahymena thermophila SB210]|uniref:Acid phosphatase n=1 Tax=Tetrahymena thermophila (strain SB210) TaxID=312017 RepID=Q23FY3_TETTS|nr:acid phosphatase [Tetrahymena thermophila SB210]EAR95477.1 acid phosphatase [Tetrahymena thermophila SB210]|eukprot:XP_001015722.1 acid phosphatase [Tetrahymena thermophila SB210]